VRDALEIGYRLVDTARMYENEAAVGAGLRASGVNRDEVFLASKIPPSKLRASDVRAETEASLRELEVDYLDLMLIHWPSEEVPLRETLGELAQLSEERKILRIGVSNFPLRHLREARSIVSIFCDQVEFHPFLGQERLLALARETGTLVMAYSPLGSGELGDWSVLERMGEKYHKTARQVALRYLLSHERVAVIPRSTSHDHRVENLDVFDFDLDAEDIAEIDDLPKDQRQIDPKWSPDWEAE
jgi:2,5-diketo-D-gluconate reductase B